MTFRSRFVEQAEVQGATTAAADLLDLLPLTAALTAEQREQLEAAYRRLVAVMPRALPEATCYINVLCGTILNRLRMPGQRWIDKVAPFKNNAYFHYRNALQWLKTNHTPTEAAHEHRRQHELTDALWEMHAWLLTQLARDLARDARGSTAIESAEEFLQQLLEMCKHDAVTVSRAWFGDTGLREGLYPEAEILNELAELNMAARRYSSALRWFERCHESHGLTTEQHGRMLICLEALRVYIVPRQKDTTEERRELEEQVLALGAKVQGWNFDMQAATYVAIVCGCAFKQDQLRHVISHCREHHIGFGDLSPYWLRQRAFKPEAAEDKAN